MKPKTTDALQRPESPLLLIGITGGIASGKSYVCAQLEQAGHTVFYCDSEAKRIIRTDPEVRRQLSQLVGSDLYDAQGQLVKSKLAAWLCKGKAHAAQVDAIVHPRVAEAFARRASELSADWEGGLPARHKEHGLPARQHDAGRKPALPEALFPPFPHKQLDSVQQLVCLPPQRVLFMECALLFESGFDRLVDCSLLIHVSASTQLQRLMARDHIPESKAHEWMALQLSEEQKLERADYVLDND
ncbi:MAG: dephospho-CoA kinase [Bacteroidales bacterium]|nr:dephospho-CoA kinase [Bacteroidales bacterium]